MKKIIISLIILASIIGCTSIESKYDSKVIQIAKDFNTQLNHLSSIYTNIEKQFDILFEIETIQEELYNVKLDLLSLNTPSRDEYRVFQSDFLRTIEEFELLTYKISGLSSLYISSNDINPIHKKYSKNEKYKKNKLSIIENLINIQEDDINRTIISCKAYLTKMKKSSVIIDNIDFQFPEFILNAGY